MTPLRLHDSRTRRKVDLAPLDPKNVRIYVCGPTVYDRAHLGNARPVVVFDVLFRLLRHLYGASHVTYVRNVTDVDDKINARAAETGRSIRDITDETLRWFHEDMDALGALRPTHEPRATEWIASMVEMIDALVAQGHAYASHGHVLFRVRSYAQYGALSGRSLDDMIAGARVEVAPYKEDPLDFVLWKPSDAATPGWESPWGFGRPGWHIECSAMARGLLGPSFDIHGGGLDLQFPHHENEIAQSRCADPHEGFAQVWMHNEMLLVDGRKMSKSLGNFFTVRDLLDQDVPGEVIRLVLLGTHYRSPMDWTAERVSEARTRLTRWFRKTDGVASSPTLTSRFEALLSDDLNIPAALGAMETLPPPFLKAAMRQLGLPDAEHVDWFRSVQVQMTGAAAQVSAPSLGSELAPYLRHWQALRDKRDYAAADAFKAKLEGVGLRLRIVGDAPMADIPSGFRIEDLADVAPEVFR